MVPLLHEWCYIRESGRGGILVVATSIILLGTPIVSMNLTGTSLYVRIHMVVTVHRYDK